MRIKKTKILLSVPKDLVGFGDFLVEKGVSHSRSALFADFLKALRADLKRGYVNRDPVPVSRTGALGTFYMFAFRMIDGLERHELMEM